MMLDKLESRDFSSLPENEGQDATLEQRMRAAMQDEERRPDFGDLVPEIQPIPPEFGTKPLPPSNEAIIDVMVRKWFFTDFLQAMMMGDPDERLGTKAEPYAD